MSSIIGEASYPYKEVFKLRFLDRFVSYSISILSIFTTILLVLMVGNIFILVISRYIFSYSFPWSEEFTRYLLIWMGLLGTSVLVRKRQHIRLTFLIDRFPALARELLEIFFYLIEIGFLILLIQKSWVWAMSMEIMTASALQISMLWPALAIPVSASLMLFYSIINMVEDLQRLIKGSVIEPSDVADVKKEIA